LYKAGEEDQIIRNEYGDIITFPPSTIWSDSTILFNNEQLIMEYGISIKFVQVDIPIRKTYLYEYANSQSVNYYITNNSFMGASIEFENPAVQWLSGIQAIDICNAMDWIKAGTIRDENEPRCNDYTAIVQGVIGYPDELEIYEGILGGTWTPYWFGSIDFYGHSPQLYGIVFSEARASIDLIKYRIPGIDVYITKDRIKWTRCPVIEMCDNDTTEAANDHQQIPGPSQGNRYKFDMRRAPSIDKDGNYADTTQPGDLINAEAANYIFSRGMGWFPGYAIDVETGRRLNMAYGEDSRLINEHGRDMLWNPTATIFNDTGYAVFGGRHVIYIFGNNFDTINSSNKKYYMPAYDAGLYMTDMLNDTPTLTYGAYNLSYVYRKRYIWQNAVWVSIPINNSGVDLSDYDSIPCGIKFELRIANPYWQGKYEYAVAPDTIDGVIYPRNLNLPMFSFSTVGYGAVIDSSGKVKNNNSELANIKIYPNPLNLSQRGNLRIDNLPESCSITISDMKGKLLGTLRKNDILTYADWNLIENNSINNNKGIYVIFVEAPGIGHKGMKLIIM
ncbi:MAG: hypothetical protein HY738_04615, partial [Bacteroidia bacterium]|nr:hypothetical protein [Bacteroidia bacterium]